MKSPIIIMPVKDSLDTAREAITAVLSSEFGERSSESSEFGVRSSELMLPHPDNSELRTPNSELLTVYNDFSTQQNTAELKHLSKTLGFRLFNWQEHTDHPSPNYRLTLQHAQHRAVAEGRHLVIVESDVTIRPDTIQCLVDQVRPGIGMVAAVTVDADGNINFPYLYARKLHGDTVATAKRFSFCCTLLTLDFLKAFPFENLDPGKSWYDVTISHMSTHLGFTNLLMLNNPVLHRPHSSRPWKQLKYTNPLKYYWQKITRKRDRI